MKKTFESRLEAIDWIARHVENEAQFEMLREQLNYTFIYSGTYFIKLDDLDLEVEIVLNEDYDYLGEQAA